MKQQKILYLSLSLALLFVASAKISKAAGPTEINSAINNETVWTTEGSPYMVKGAININAPLTIEPGVVVKFSNEAVNYSTGGLIVKSSLMANGTPLEKIIFTSTSDSNYGGDTSAYSVWWSNLYPRKGDWSGISLNDSPGNIKIENAIISYAGTAVNHRSIYKAYYKGLTVKNSEIKNNDIGIYLRDVEPYLENNSIHNNGTGIKVYCPTYSGRLPSIKNSAIYDNGNGVDATGAYSPIAHFDARNNWWGDASGPYSYYFNPSGKGNRVIGNWSMFNPWFGRNPLIKRKPVILVPGIGASVNLDKMIGGIMNDNWTLFSHTYDGIIEAFKEMGYEEGKDFFIAYYDWRDKNEDSARDYLEPSIKKAISLNDTSKVNIVAHSMGGLVARSYIQSDDYDNDVDNLFLIGTPNKGSSDVYPVWEGGYIPDNWDNDLIIKIYLKYLNTKKLTFSNYESIHRYVFSVKQLMPIYDYIYSKGDPENIKNYSEMNEVNNWLENLNADIQKLNDRVKVSIISGNGQNTVNNIPVIDTDENPLWIDGKPDPLDPERNDSAGDNRVLLSSSQIQSLYNDTLNDTHGGIVSQSEQLIAGRINEDLETIYPAPDIPNELGFWFASPVDVEIKDPQDRIISGNINEIPLAKYASESKPDGFKIVSIPNPVDGKYEIKITGNGNGEFHIGSEYMDYEDGANDRSSFIAGKIVEGEENKYIIKYDPTDPQGPVTPIFPENLDSLIDYVNDQKELNNIDQKEADFILTKLKVIKQLTERAGKKEEKENVVENYKEQVNKQIDWLIGYIQKKSDKKSKGVISEIAKSLLIESLNFIKYK